MCSLLSIELNKYNSNIKSIDNNTFNSVSYVKEITNNINNIKNKNKNNIDNANNAININNEYKLDKDSFNPSKNSPPSEWQIRLQNRLKNLDNILMIN